MSEAITLPLVEGDKAACALGLPGGILVLAVRELYNRARVEQLYSIDEAAAVLGKSRRFVWGLVDDGALAPFYFVGSQRRIPESALQRYLDARVV